MRNLYQVLAVVAAVNAAIGAYYYLRVVGVMYLRTPLRPLTGSRAVPTFVAAVVLAAATLFFGVYPQPLVKAARNAAPVPAEDPGEVSTTGARSAASHSVIATSPSLRQSCDPLRRPAL